MSCCGGENNSRFDIILGKWFCKDCGKEDEVTKKLDFTKVYPMPNEYYGGYEGDCECGSFKLGSDKHSPWCPCYRGTP